MRLSCREDDAGYLPWVQHKRRHEVDVFLDGDLLRGVITADEEEGFVLVHEKGEDGKLKLNETRDEVLTKRLTGLVRIYLPPSP